MDELLKNKSGIYKIQNIINNLLYIGSTVDFKQRKNEHFLRLRNNNHYNNHLQNAWNKYKEENFIFEIIEECDIENLLTKEQYWIDKFESFKEENGYNKNPFAGRYYNIPIPVAQLDLQGNLIEIYDSIKSANLNVMGYKYKKRNDIGAVLKNKQKTAFGYLWIYYNENTLKNNIKKYLKSKINQSNLIEQIDIKTGEVLNIFNGVGEAEKFLNKNINNSTILSCLRGKYKNSHGYFWRRFEYVENRKPIFYLGCDPGFKGAISLIKEDNSQIFNFPIPLIKNELDLKRLSKYFKSWQGYIKTGVLEDVHSVFGSSAKSNFQFGRIVGILQMALSITSIPHTLVQPKKWQSVWEGVPIQKVPTGKKNKKDEPMYKTDTKATSLLAAQRLFPNVDLRASERCKILHDGIVDALLMAEYCRRNFK